MPTKKEKPAEEAAEVTVTVPAQANPNRNKDNMAEAEKALDTGIAAYNAALAVQDVDAMREAEEAIKKAEKEYAEAAECDVFATCKAEEHPLRKAAEIHSYHVLGHRALREDNILTGYEKSTQEKPIDLAKLARKCGLTPLWTHDVESLNQILTLRVAKEMGLPAEVLKSISKSYFMSRMTDAIEAGKTPTSNNQMVKMLQDICDKILGVNVVRVNNHDIAYIEAAHTKKGRDKIAINTANHDFMRRLVLDVLHRCVTGKVYEVEYRKAKA
jgi:hypothetical protein